MFRITRVGNVGAPAAVGRVKERRKEKKKI
jgi:hypothetical protein